MKKHHLPRFLRTFLVATFLFFNLTRPFSFAQNVETNISSSGLDTVVTPMTNQDAQIHNITGGTRRNDGKILFHSFGEFSIGENDVANFANDTGLATENILSRVTGDTRSDIYGTIRTTEFPGANFFLLNPVGIMFGPKAQIDVDGAFHASTANYILFEDGARFDVDPASEVPLLITAPPQAFGFLEKPAPITVEGSELNVEDLDLSLSLVGGEIDITDAKLDVFRLQIASLQSSGELTISQDGLQMDSTVDGGQTIISGSLVSAQEGIAIKAGEFVLDQNTEMRSLMGIHVDVDQLLMDESSLRGAIDGDIAIEADRVDITNGAFIQSISANGVSAEANDIHVIGNGESFTGITTTNVNLGGNAGPISVKAGTIEVRNRAEIKSETRGEGSAGDVDVTANRVILSGDGSDEFTGIASQTLGESEDGTGPGGNITIAAGNIEVRNGAEINTLTTSGGQGGDIHVNANEILLVGQGILTAISSQASATSEGNAGNVTVKAGNLEVRSGAEITSDTRGKGLAGNVTVEADRVLLSGDGLLSFTGFSSQSVLPCDDSCETGIGDGGNVVLKNTGTLEVRDRAQISASTGTEGRGGNIDIHADQIILTGNGDGTRTGITVRARDGSTGRAGNVTVSTDDLLVQNGAQISATTAGMGQGGKIDVDANQITLRDGGTISAQSTTTGLGGEPGRTARSGDIVIIARENFRLLNESSVNVTTEEANAGSIDTQAGFLLLLRDGSQISTSVAGGTSDGGNINIDPVFVVLDGASEIIANAQRGRGGNIDIRIVGGGALFQSPDSVIDASSNTGIDGTVAINAPDSDIISGLQELPENIIDIATVLSKPCAQRSGADVIELAVRRYEILPDSPYALRVPGLDTTMEMNVTGQTNHERQITSPEKFSRLAITCPDNG